MKLARCQIGLENKLGQIEVGGKWSKVGTMPSWSVGELATETTLHSPDCDQTKQTERRSMSKTN